MSFDKVFVFVILFVFIGFLFPVLYDAITNSTITSSVKPALDVFPYVFLACVLLIPVYMIARGRSK